jgi:hypothetical protein
MKKRLKIVLAVLCCVLVAIFSGTVYADIYLVPLDVNGFYGYLDKVDFNIDLGVQFTQINEVRIQAQGSITAVDAPGFLYFSLPAAVDKIWYLSGPVIYPSSPPVSVPFSMDTPFLSGNGATWDFLLDGTADGYVVLVTGMPYADEGPIPNITGYIDSAFLLIDAVPVPEPATISVILFSLPFLRKFAQRK